ncbi:copper chaperone PCu(A)C [Nocardiopsis lambiniae]|uniref:Copper chaperone PCu(A)C n=1 Tax=Nocardiopsis lambiniae TaxID=3075539 RepID=A0ABU2MDC5_9ACTN|nr:copper chaperone PCu(A)C [Nocardiopsis sp. DSM 44743]MDT0330679.1 copper chaperone PCu(A)C [Nocardiopsis sp. DSM 44743]
MNPTRTVRTLSVATLLALTLTACGGGGAASTAPETAPEGTPSPSGEQADAFSITDPWVKAVTAEDGMTGVFGEIANGSDAEIVIVSAGHPAAETVELHEVVTEGADATMREIDGGFPVAPRGARTLEPGGDHIMLMGLTEDLEPGTEATVTVEFADGSTAAFTAPVKEYAGANEEYDGDGHEGH